MDKALKQRLVGASVLIALAVIVLPMLLSGQPDGQQETRSIEVPPKPSELSFETRRFPVGQTASAQASSEPEVTVSETEPNAVPPSPPPASPEPDGESDAAPPAPAERPLPDSSPARSPGRYLVQVASFSTTDNANNLARRLRSDGLPVLLDTVESAVGILHRVRVGPFDELGQANQALETIRSRTPDVNPRIFDLRPDEASPLTEPSDPLVRWVVQAGSFSEQENADSLVAKLKQAGFAAYRVTTAGAGGTLYKVRIGPEIERQAALDIAKELGRKVNLDGIVMSVD
ncbi:MAG TPA: SPOR domain-containing protein [Xanthomonadales bacterium]|nr:SPOR domain-containing protein [Xanthomonadales bacterium]